MRLIRLAIVTFLVFAISACGQQETMTEHDQEYTSSIPETSELSSSSDAAFSVDKTIFENEYAVVTLKDIKSDGLNLDVKSKLENRAERIVFDGVALDGLCVPVLE